MALIRVRLLFDCPLRNTSKQCWMLLDTSSCKFVHDLEFMIVKKFFVGGHNILNLYLDDFLLPSHEKIELIRENDIIRVKEVETPTSKNENRKKRKFEESNNDSKKQSKKMKHSLDQNKEKQNTVTEKQSNHSNKTEAASTKTLKNFKNKSKSKRAAAFLHKVFKDKRKVGSNKTTCTVNTKTQKKHLTKPLKEKMKSDNLEINNKVNLTSSNEKHITVSALHPVETKELLSAPLRVGKGDTTINEKLKSDEVVGGSHGCQGIINNTKQDKKVNEDKMSSPLILSSRNYTFSRTSSVTRSSSSNSDSEYINGDMVQKNNFIVQDLNVSKTQQQQQLNTANQHGRGTVPLMEQIDIPWSDGKHGSHIRFDDEADSIVTTQVSTFLSCLAGISPVCPATSCPTGTLCMSPIQPNVKTYNAQRASDVRKDVYTNRSTLMESTRVEKETQELCPIPNSIPEKDFSKYQLLHGPPRVGETVAYKILELSQSYTPEISKYKEGKVLAFNPVTNVLKLKLTKESLSRVTGDGYVSLKFELLCADEEEECGEPIHPVEIEIEDEVQVQWSSMIEPRLVVETSQ